MNQQNHRMSKGKYFIGSILIALSVWTPQVLAAAEDITGQWDLTMDFNGMQTLATLTLAKAPSGTLTGKWGSSELKDVKFDAGKLTFTRTMSMMGQDMTMKFAGTIKDGKLTGNLSGDQGDNAVTGARKKAKSAVLGQWDIKYNVGGQDVTAKLILAQNAKGAVDANWITDMSKSVVSNVKIDGDKVTFSRKITMQDNSFDATFEGSVKDGKLAGTMKSEMGDSAITGTRIGAALIGNWEITRTTQQGTRTSMLMIDTDLSGRMESFMGETPIKDLKIDGNQVTFKTEMTMQDQTMVTQYKLTLDGKNIKGQSTSERGTNDLTGKKVEPAAAATR